MVIRLAVLIVVSDSTLKPNGSDADIDPLRVVSGRLEAAVLVGMSRARASMTDTWWGFIGGR